MSFMLKSSTPDDGGLFSDFLLQLEENPTPETLQKLHLKIDMLEQKLFEQAKLAHCKELEIHNTYGEKKGQWIFKYLEVKAQLASCKKLSQEKESLWKQDSANLLRIIKYMFKILDQSEAKTLNFLRDIDQELTKTVRQRDVTSTCFIPDMSIKNEEEPVKTDAKATRSPSNDIGQVSGNDKESNESKVKGELVFQTPKQLSSTAKKLPNSTGGIFAKISSPTLFVDCKNVLNHVFKTPKADGQYRAKEDCTKANQTLIKNCMSSLCESVASSELAKYTTPQTLSIGLNTTITNIQTKLKDYITQLTQNSASQQLRLNREINKVLERIASFSENQNLERNSDLSFGFSSERTKEVPHRSSLLTANVTPFHKNKVPHLPACSISSNLLNELEGYISHRSNYKVPNRAYNYSTEQKGREESYRMGKKVLDKSLGPKHQDAECPSSQKDIRKRLDSLQNSLALSEKEALLCMLMDNIDNNKQTRDVNLDELLRATNIRESSLMSNFFPQSVSKLRGNSVSSFCCDGSDMKPQSNVHYNEPVDQFHGYMRTPSILEWQNNDMEDFSPHFLANNTPHVDKFTIFTPITKKRSSFASMNRPSSPRLGAEIDIDMQNVDLGSFVCHNEDTLHQEIDTIGLNDALGRDGISPILAKGRGVAKKLPQYNFPNSVEKEYGRRLGGALDFDDEHVEDFDSKYIKEEESVGTEEYGRMPTAEGTESVKKGREEGKRAEEILRTGDTSGQTSIFNFQTFSAQKV